MEEVSKEGRTVLFVSHNMWAVRKLCPKSILLNAGKVEMQGKTTELIRHYIEKLNTSSTESENPAIRDINKIKDDVPQIIATEMRDKGGNLRTSFTSTEEIHVKMKIRTGKGLVGNLNPFWHIYNSNMEKLASSGAYQLQERLFDIDAEQISFVVYPEALIPDDYSLSLQIAQFRVKVVDLWERAIDFKITENDYNGTGFNYPGFLNGQIFVKGEWEKK